MSTQQTQAQQDEALSVNHDPLQTGGQAPGMLANAAGSGGAAALQRRILQRKADQNAPAPAVAAPGTGEEQQALPKGLTEDDVTAATAAAAKDKLGGEAISQLQASLGVTPTGAYDRATVIAAHTRQVAMGVPKKGKPSKDFFARLGLIYTHTIAPAKVEDGQLEDIKARFPSGVAVPVYSHYEDQSVNNREITNRAHDFAKQAKTVGVNGGNLTVGAGAIPIREVGEIVESVQSIHRGLLEKHRAAQAPTGGDDAAEKDEQKANKEGDGIPAFTKIKNLAIFSHGMQYGVSTDAGGSYSKGLHSEKKGVNPSNIKSFVQGISDAVVPDIGVQLYACNTGKDTSKTDYEEWTGHKQGERTGEQSFAEKLADELGPEANVYGHTTAGHTTENFAARVYGKSAGGDGGLHMFDVMYDEAFIQSELARLYPDQSEEERALYHDGLREQMWSHFKDSISNEHHRSSKDKQYETPIGREMFYNPDNAKSLLHSNWTTQWIPSRLKNVKAKAAPKKKVADKGEEEKKEQKPDQPADNGGGGGNTVAKILSASVGKDGDNKAADVEKVQRKLADRGIDPGPIDSDCGKKTIAAIKQFQAGFMNNPDGKIDAGGTSEKKLFG